MLCRSEILLRLRLRAYLLLMFGKPSAWCLVPGSVTVFLAIFLELGFPAGLFIDNFTFAPPQSAARWWRCYGGGLSHMRWRANNCGGAGAWAWALVWVWVWIFSAPEKIPKHLVVWIACSPLWSSIAQIPMPVSAPTPPHLSKPYESPRCFQVHSQGCMSPERSSPASAGGAFIIDTKLVFGPLPLPEFPEIREFRELRETPPQQARPDQIQTRALAGKSLGKNASKGYAFYKIKLIFYYYINKLLMYILKII